MVRGGDENFDDADYERLYAWSNLIAIQFFKEKFQMLFFLTKDYSLWYCCCHPGGSGTHRHRSSPMKSFICSMSTLTGTLQGHFDKFDYSIYYKFHINSAMQKHKDHPFQDSWGRRCFERMFTLIKLFLNDQDLKEKGSSI